jgi:hypothetical protein
MNTMLLRSTLLCSLGALLGAGLAAAEKREVALGSNGEVYQVKAGTYGELFPGSSRYSQDFPVLALDVTAPGEEPHRILVPTSADADVESSAAVIFEDASNTAFLIWESRHSYHSQLRVASWDGSRWAEPIPPILGGNLLSPKTLPQIVVTRDSYAVPSLNGPVTRISTSLHLLWAEEVDDALDTFYMPVILENGVCIGETPLYRLSDFEGEGDGAAALATQAPANNLQRAPALLKGRDERTVIVGFSSIKTHRVVTLEIDTLPQALTNLAGGARAQIIDIGARLSYPANVKALGERVRSAILQSGTAFETEIVQALADRTRDLITTNGGGGRPQNLVSLAGAARAQIIDIGAKLAGRGLKNLKPAALAQPVRIEEVAGTSAGQPISHLIQFRVVSSRPAPSVGSGDVMLFLSTSGEEVLVSWNPGDGHIYYRQSQGGDWNDPIDLKLNRGLDLPGAYGMLEKRIR